MSILRTLTAAAIGAALFNWLAHEKREREALSGVTRRLDDGDAPDATSLSGFKLESREIQAGSTIDARFEFNGFDCGGENKSPALVWSGAPEGTQSFALTLYDPDAPTGSGWWHWVVVDVPGHVSGLNPDAGAADGSQLAAGARQLRNDYGQIGFGGVCPPRGERAHRYVFTVYALKVPKLAIPDDATPALAGFMIHSNLLAQASFTARYGRPEA